MKSLKELWPGVVADFKNALADCAQGNPNGFTLQAKDGRRLCVYVVPAEYEAAVDAVIASVADHATDVQIKPIGDPR